ncbi:DUF4839 domain-containing protein [Micromonospora aurantiaca (nom. illeg.)]|uniref:DUF4839 domain-containing protein n=1 Tax=Micromonospora aurantiaca (nom. illeg.) TaxID=47850 RepID=UPI003EB8881A
MRKMAALVVPVLALLVGCEVPEAEPTDAGTEKAKAKAPKTVTVENNPDFAALLTGPPHGKTVEAAVEKFQSKTVEFDGFVSAIYINPREHNGASTIDVMAGDASDKKHTGPVFQLSWYGHEDPMEKLAKGTNVHVKALAGAMYEFEPFQYYLIDEDPNDSESPLIAR